VSVIHLLGIAGVAEHESPQAKKWARRLEWPIAGLALWIVVQWYLEETRAIPHELARLADWLVWHQQVSSAGCHPQGAACLQ